VANLLAGCCRDFAVTFVGPPPASPADREAVAGQCERVVWLGTAAPEGLRRRIGTWWRSFVAAPGIRRLDSVRRYVPIIAALGTVDLGSYAIVWAERPHVARAVASERARTIIDLDDIEHRRMAQARQFAPPRGLLGAAEEAYRLALYRWIELSWARGFLATVVCSEGDRQYLNAQGVENAVVIPNGVGAASPPAAANAAARLSVQARRRSGAPLKLVFLGNLGHPPNLDAIGHFVADMLPRLRAADPRTTFDVLGPAATAGMRAQFAGQATFRGFVPDLQSALDEYDILVAPIRYGSGTRVKLLDAMACGIPIVSTGAGAEGLPVVAGRDLMLADGPEEFVRQVLLLKADPVLGERLARSAAALVDSQFTGAVIQEEVARCLRRLVTPGPPGDTVT
jgi:glycosyltransferase involved in cell wall biosynthesis